MRTSNDQLDQHGHVWNGYDYNLQTWIVDGKVTRYCNGLRTYGSLICDVKAAQVRITTQ